MASTILTDASFDQEVLKAELPVLVDFWAVWCYPCKAQAPIIEELSSELAGKIKFAKMEVDDNPTTPAKYNVLSIPTLIVFKGGEIVWQGVGVHQKQILLDELKQHI